MRFNGENLEAVLDAHERWFFDEANSCDDDRADFSGAQLSGQSLRGRILWGANLRGCDLRTADLYGCDLRRADMTGAMLFGCDLHHAKLRGAINVPFIPLACPDTGSFTAWKKCIYRYADGRLGEDVIVKLLIPEDADRSSDIAGECRATKALVLEIQTLDGKVLIDGNTQTEDCAVSIRDKSTEYRVGRITSVPKLGEDRFWHFSPGIFFYINRRQAIEYMTLGTDRDGKLINADPLKEAIIAMDDEIRKGYDPFLERSEDN